jgi:hypothetical protein
MLDKMKLGNLLPSGFFSRKKRVSQQPTHNRSQNLPQRSRYPKSTAGLKKTRRKPNSPRGNPNSPRSDQEQPRKKPGNSADRSLQTARRSPDMGSRRGELEEALSDLLKPRQDFTVEVDTTDTTTADSLTVIPPRASGSQPQPGFLSDIDQPTTPTLAPQKPPADRAAHGKTISAKPSLKVESHRQSSAGRNSPLDFRRALQQETYQDTLARHVADATTVQNRPDLHKTQPSASPAEEASEVSMAESRSNHSENSPPHALANNSLPKEKEGDETPQPQAATTPPEEVVAGEQTTKRPNKSLEKNQLRMTATLPSPNMAKAISAGNPGSLEKTRAEANGDEVKFAEEHAEGGLLFSYKQPMIASHVEGPQRILVGREANYRVTLRNQGNTVADSLIATVHIPAWAEVVDATSSQGIVQKAEPASTTGTDAANGNSLQWRIQQLKSGSSQTLNLRLVPHRGRPMQLGVSWILSPVGSTAVVEVQEPKLQMMISGPEDVLFGKPQRYQLTLSNPGTGIAEEVWIKLVPPGGNTDSAITHEIGLLQPGKTQTIDLELTAREAGDLQVQALATAAGNLRADTTKHLFCRKPELELDWRGPDTKYAGTEATYYFRLRNSGSAPVDPLQLKLQLPAGVKYVEASGGDSFDAQKQHVTWQLAGLQPQEEKFVQVRCHLDQAGPCVMQLTAQTVAGEFQDEKTIKTEVIALADLKLEISDPKGPVPVGESAVYEIRVANRGTNHAQGVNIVGLFSEGIDPVSVEGAQFSIRDGRVSFRTIKNLPAGRDIVLRIHAKALQPGMHLFRAEVACQDLDIKLSSEETTRFFKDEFRWAEGSTPYMAERKAMSAPVIRR